MPRAEVERALTAVGLADRIDDTVRSLSGGQRQRALFARILVSGAPVALLDEPTAGMDALAEREVLDLLDRLRAEFGLTLIAVSHARGTARDRADHLLFVDRELGRALAGPTTEVLAHPDFRARYGAVLEAV